MIKISKNKILRHVVRFEFLVGIQNLKYEFRSFLQLLQKKLIRPQILHTTSEKYVQYTKMSVSKKGAPKRVKSYFKKKNLEK